jgi:hypothetical protein
MTGVVEEVADPGSIAMMWGVKGTLFKNTKTQLNCKKKEIWTVSLISPCDILGLLSNLLRSVIKVIKNFQ